MPAVPCPGLALAWGDRAGDTRQCCRLWVGPVGWGAGSAQSFVLPLSWEPPLAQLSALSFSPCCPFSGLCHPSLSSVPPPASATSCPALCFPSWLCAPCPTPCLPHRFVRMLQRTRAALVPQRTLQISWPDAHSCTGPPSPARPLPRTSLPSAVTRSWEPSRAGDAWVPSGGAGGATALALPPQMAWLCKAVLIQAAASVEHEQLHKGRRWRSCSCVQAG